jgi:enoyl-CoA hydratase/carnithine racemase
MSDKKENQLVLYELDEENGIATITLNRPDKRNALNWKMFARLSDIVDKIIMDQKVRLVLIRAAGGHFSSGIDFNLLVGQDPDAPKYSFEPAPFRYMVKHKLQPIFTKLATLEKPTIAIINGMCLGSGFELILACDFRFATKSAIFQMKESLIGIIPDLGGTTRLLSLVNTSQAKEICLAARAISAADGYRMGFLNGVSDDLEKLELDVQELIKDLLLTAPLAYGLGKKVIEKINGKSIAEGLDETAAANSILINTKDFRRGLSAMMEKKPVKWKGN